MKNSIRISVNNFSTYLAALLLLLVANSALANIEITSTHCVCPGGFGSIEVTAEADPGMVSAGPFSFVWTGPVDSITGMPYQSYEEDIYDITVPGAYSVTVTNSFGCEVVLTTNVASCSNTQISALQVVCMCPGGVGGVQLGVTGNDIPYSYMWIAPNGTDIVDTTKHVSTLNEPGTYTVMVTGNSGCTTPFTVLVPACNFDISNFTVITTNSCNASNSGAISVQVPPGQGFPPYSFHWTSATGVPLTQVTTNANSGYSIAQGLAVGNYCLEVKSLASGCVAQTCSLSVGGGQAPVVDYTIQPSSPSVLGSIDLSIQGGTGPFSYSWSNGATTQDVSQLAPGTYTVNISYAGGSCSLTQNITVHSCTDLNNLILQNTQALVFATTNGGNDGAIDISIPGAEHYSLTYKWTWPDNITQTNDQDIVSAGPGNYLLKIGHTACNGLISFSFTICGFGLAIEFNGANPYTCAGVNVKAKVAPVAQGYKYLWTDNDTTSFNIIPYGMDYCVTVTDVGDCSAQKCVRYEMPPITLTMFTSIATFGNQDGTAKAVPQGGIAPYSYLWSNGGTTQTIVNLGPGIYSVTVTDACNTTKTAEVEVECKFGNSDVVGTVTNLNCSTSSYGTINLTLDPQIQQPVFQWSNGAITKDVSGLIAGNYAVTVTDLLSQCYTVRTFNVVKTGAIAVTITGDSGCRGAKNGEVTANPIGGFTPLSYAWTGDPVPVGVATQTVSNLGFGTYTVTVSDAQGCSGTASHFLDMGEQAFDAFVWVSPQPMCQGQLATAMTWATPVGSGTPPFTYKWSDCFPCNPIGNDWSVTGLTKGPYTLEMTDAHGCKSLKLFSVQASNINLNADVHHPCDSKIADGYIQLNPSGGVAPYSYLWSNGATSSGIFDLVGTGTTYTVTVTDAAGCLKVQSFYIKTKINSFTIGIVQTPCFEQNNGKLNVLNLGGYAPYSYQWSNGLTTQSIDNLGAGNYCVTVTDGNGCAIPKCKTLTHYQSIELISIQNPTTLSSNNGNIDIEVANSVGNVSYLWSNGITTQDNPGLSPGVYCVTVTGQNCNTTRCFTLSPCSLGGIPLPISVSVGSRNNLTGANTNDGAININVGGGSGNFYYTWNGPGGYTAFSEDISNLTGGKYCVTVVDGCASPKSLCTWVGYCGDNSAAIPLSYQCRTPNSTVNVDVVSSGFSGNLTYLFDPQIFDSGSGNFSDRRFQTNSSLLLGGVNNISVTLTDEAGCQASASMVIERAFSEPDGWNYSSFNMADANDFAAFQYLYNYVNASAQWNYLIVNPYISGCKTHWSCPVSNAPTNTGLACANEETDVVYEDCDCDDLPQTIDIFCDNQASVPGFEAYPSWHNGEAAQLVESVVFGCTRYCLYANAEPYGYVFKIPLSNSECGGNGLPNNNGGSAECSFTNPKYCVSLTNNGRCYIVSYCPYGAVCGTVYSEFSMIQIEGAILIEDYFFIQDFYPNLAESLSSLCEEQTCTCADLQSYYGTCPQCLLNDDPQEEFKAIATPDNYAGSDDIMSVLPNPIADYFTIELLYHENSSGRIVAFNNLVQELWSIENVSLQKGINKINVRPENELGAGLYQLFYYDDSGKILQAKFVKI